MNDWEIKKFFKVVLAIQLAMWGVIGLDAVGLQIPILRQFIGFIYLTIIPGILILRILKVHKLGNIETLLYTVGLSITTLMFTGLFMNTVYPFFGISGPISIIRLIITISMIVLVLFFLSYVRDKDFSNPSFIYVREVLSPPALFLCLVPFLAIFGTYLMNFYQNNILLMFLIIILAIIALLISFDKFIPQNLYPLAVFVIAISLLYYISLISLDICGWDIQTEYYISNLVLMNSYWDPSIGIATNAMLAIVILAPIYSNLCSMSLTWVFKIIFTFLFSFVPLGLYRVYQKQTDDKIAFLACFFFVSITPFYVDMSQLARQQIAELFVVLLILVIICRDMTKIKRSFLIIVFGMSLVVSHYGTSYLYMLCLISVWLIVVLGENLEMQKLMSNFYSKFSGKSENIAGDPVPIKVDRTISSTTFVLLFITFTLAWYMYVSSSSSFDSIVRIGDHIASSVFKDFLNPETVQGLELIIKPASTSLYRVLKCLHLLTQFFILVGILTLMLKHKEMDFKDEYAAFSLAYFALCLAGIAIPFFASALNTTRLYHITLIFLAPFCVIGGITVFKILNRVIMASWTNKSVRYSLEILAVFLAIFLLFNTGFVFTIANQPCSIISLNSTLDYPRFNEQEIAGVNWLTEVKGSVRRYTYADNYRYFLLRKYNLQGRITCFPFDVTKIRADSYIYFGTRNIVKNEVLFKHPGVYINAEDIVNGRNKLYANGGAEIYHLI